jgi:hypothetical protein
MRHGSLASRTPPVTKSSALVWRRGMYGSGYCGQYSILKVAFMAQTEGAQMMPR